MRNRSEKGRGHDKLTKAEVAEIRLFLVAGDVSQRPIASWYGVSHQHVNHINTGHKHAMGNLTWLY